MDYLPVNFNMEKGRLQGDYAMIGIGPYDMWAIEYGYSFEKDYAKVLKRVSEANLCYGTDEDTSGPDPLARRYDFSKKPTRLRDVTSRNGKVPSFANSGRICQRRR